MTQAIEVPVMYVTLHKDGTVSGTCPYCGKTHTHGSAGSRGPDFGHRVSHCDRPRHKDDHGYFLKLRGT
jgi:hypothetical protein